MIEVNLMSTPELQRVDSTDSMIPPRYYLFIASLLFTISFLKGLRMPSLWVTTHLTFNYSHGFIRRGLIGELLRVVGGTKIYNYNVLAGCSFVLLVVVLVVLSRFIKRTIQTDVADAGLQAAILVFGASPAFVFFIHEIGYFDYFGLLAVLSLVLLSYRSTRRYLIFYAAGLIGVTLAFIHEGQVILFFPTIFFVMVCHIVKHDKRGDLPPRSRRLLVAATVGAIAVAYMASLVVILLGTKDTAVIHALQASVAKVANFPLREYAFEVLYQPDKERLTLMAPYWRNPDHQIMTLRGFVVIVPGYAFLIYYGLSLLGRLDLSRITRLIIKGAFLAASLSPLILNLVSIDSARWSALSVVTCFCCVASIRLFFPPRPLSHTEPGFRVISPLTLTLAAAAILLGLVSNQPLFDGYKVQLFPFGGHLRFVIELFQGHFSYLPLH